MEEKNISMDRLRLMHDLILNMDLKVRDGVLLEHLALDFLIAQLSGK